MRFREEIERVFDLPYTHAMREMETKLYGTLIKINGELVFLIGAGDNENTLRVQTGFGPGIKTTTYPYSKIKRIDLWTPDTGVYQTREGEVCFIYKKPIRQWKKSFSPDYYNIKFHTSVFALHKIMDCIPKEIWVRKDGAILYYESPIGYVGGVDTVICVNPLFEQELIDWAKT